MQKQTNSFYRFAAIAGIVAGVGDFVVTFAAGFFYPGYDHLRLVMSELGTARSPVAFWVNTWWILFGAFFVAFALGLWQHCRSHKIPITIIVLLIAVFGLGAGIGGGLFPMEPGGLEMTTAGKLHGIFAGLGFMAIAFVPLVGLWIFPRSHTPRLFWLSGGAFILGFIFFVLFVAAEDAIAGNLLLGYVGLWQRLFLLNHYGYLGLFAARMLRH